MLNLGLAGLGGWSFPLIPSPTSPLAAFLQQELQGAGRVLGPCTENPPAPVAREALRVQEQSEQLARELREVSRNRAALRGRLQDLRQYLHVLREGQRLTSMPVGAGTHQTKGTSVPHPGTHSFLSVLPDTAGPPWFADIKPGVL